MPADEYGAQMYNGALAVIGGAPGQPAPDLIETIKNMQRSDPEAREQWKAFCDTMSARAHDPAKHDPSFLQSFLDQYGAGMRWNSPGGLAGRADFVDLFKEGQRRSMAFKEAWHQYCDVFGGGMPDPARHQVSFLLGFLDFLAWRAIIVLEGGVVPPENVERDGIQPRSKRPRTSQQSFSTASPIGPDLLDDDKLWKDQLVMRVKGVQRSGGQDAWAMFVEQQNHYGGPRDRDPNRHSPEALQMFLTMHASNAFGDTASQVMN